MPAPVLPSVLQVYCGPSGVGQPVQGAVALCGVIQETHPLVNGPVAGDDEAGHPVPVEYEIMEIGGLLGGEPMQAQAV